MILKLAELHSCKQLQKQNMEKCFYTWVFHTFISGDGREENKRTCKHAVDFSFATHLNDLDKISSSFVPISITSSSNLTVFGEANSSWASHSIRRKPIFGKNTDRTSQDYHKPESMQPALKAISLQSRIWPECKTALVISSMCFV